MKDKLLNDPSRFKTDTYTISPPFDLSAFTPGQPFNPENRFYVCNSTIFLNDGQFQTFVDQLKGLEEVKKTEGMIASIDLICNQLKTRFKQEYDKEVANFDNAKNDPSYVSIDTYAFPVINSEVSFTTPATVDLQVKQQRLKDLYANNNLNTTDSFDGKVTLN